MTSNIVRLAFLILVVSSACATKEPQRQLIYQYTITEFNRDSLIINNFMATKQRYKYEILNDTVIYISNLVDSVKPWDSTKYEFERHAEKNDSLFSGNGRDILFGTNIRKNTKILIQYSGGYIDTLNYYCFKTYNGLKVYSFYCASCTGMDSGYNIFLCDSIGIIATYAGPWRMISVLDKIYNSDILNKRLQGIKAQLLIDSLFYPVPLECFDDNDTVKYTPPIIVEE